MSIPDRHREAVRERPILCALMTIAPHLRLATIPESAQSPFGLLPQPRNRVSLMWTWEFSFMSFSQLSVQGNSGPAHCGIQTESGTRRRSQSKARYGSQKPIFC
jgi:hypothetical protein